MTRNFTAVSTEKELECALERRDSKIVLQGPKAAYIVAKLEAEDAKKRNIRNVGIIAAIALIAAAPLTGGTSLLGLGATATAWALSDSVIIALITGAVTITVEAARALKEYKIARLAHDKIEFTRK